MLQGTLYQAFNSNGITPSKNIDIESDGGIHRFHIKGDRIGSENGWYIAHKLINGHAAGRFGCWKRNISEKFATYNGADLSPDETKRIREVQLKAQAQAEKAKKEAWIAAAEKAKDYIKGLNPASNNHPYLSRKGIRSHGLLIANDSLIMPLRNEADEIRGYQRITPEGNKRFQAGATPFGLHFRIGSEHKAGAPLVLSESYSTGSSCYESYFEALKIPVYVTCGKGNLALIADQLIKKFPNDPLVILGDDDWTQDKNPGASAARKIILKHGGAVIFPRFSKKRTPWGDKDFNDLATKEGAETVRKQLSRWQDYITKPLSKTTRKDSEGNEIEVTTKSIHNIVVYLITHPIYQALAGFNEFDLATYAVYQPPWDRSENWNPRAWTDFDDLSLAKNIQSEWMNISHELACKAMEIVARCNSYHPVRDYLESLQWDGTKRIDTWIIDYFDADNTEYTRQVSSKWMISAVARIYQPGCKVDTLLVLESSEQGLGKSTSLRVLGGDYFSDCLPDISQKDAMQYLQGVWINEIAELDGFNRKETSQIKAFASRDIDKFRPPYGRRSMKIGRQCIFAGTVNETHYLKDHTGNRRFWPVTCAKHADISKLEKERDQLWAEAVARFKSGEKWHLTDKKVIAEAKEQQASRETPLLWEEEIGVYLTGQDDTSVAEILNFIGVEPKHQKQQDQNTVAKVLQKLGWIRYNARISGNRQWRYKLPKAPQPSHDGSSGSSSEKQSGTAQNPHKVYDGSSGSRGTSIDKDLSEYSTNLDEQEENTTMASSDVVQNRASTGGYKKRGGKTDTTGTKPVNTGAEGDSCIVVPPKHTGTTQQNKPCKQCAHFKPGNANPDDWGTCQKFKTSIEGSDIALRCTEFEEA